jgi:hypothetical protein
MSNILAYETCQANRPLLCPQWNHPVLRGLPYLGKDFHFWTNAPVKDHVVDSIPHLVGGASNHHLEKSWSSSMGFGWHPIYEMEHNPNVWNHQPDEDLMGF